jgi:hypothetical protein
MNYVHYFIVFVLYWVSFCGILTKSRVGFARVGDLEARHDPFECSLKE